MIQINHLPLLLFELQSVKVIQTFIINTTVAPINISMTLTVYSQMTPNSTSVHNTFTSLNINVGKTMFLFY
jgi:hypothetical protein